MANNQLTVQMLQKGVRLRFLLFSEQGRPVSWLSSRVAVHREAIIVSVAELISTRFEVGEPVKGGFELPILLHDGIANSQGLVVSLRDFMTDEVADM